MKRRCSATKFPVIPSLLKGPQDPTRPQRALKWVIQGIILFLLLFGQSRGEDLVLEEHDDLRVNCSADTADEFEAVLWEKDGDPIDADFIEAHTDLLVSELHIVNLTGIVSYSLQDTTLIWEQTQNLWLQRRRYSTDHLICWLIKNVTPLRQISPQGGLFIIPYINWSIMYLLCRSKRFDVCSEIKVAPWRLWDTMLTGADAGDYECLSGNSVVEEVYLSVLSNETLLIPLEEDELLVMVPAGGKRVIPCR